MENTLENKKKLFSIYFWQKVVCASTIDKKVSLMHQTIFTYPDEFKNYCLDLKPLSSITDEDAIILMNIIYPEFDKKEILYKKDRFIYFISKNPIYHISMECVEDNCIYVFDYLRSKGYALPWMGLSVEKQIEYGWIRLTD